MEKFYYAGFGKRLLAFIIDQILLQTVTTIVLLPFWIFFGAGASTMDEWMNDEGIRSIALQNGDDDLTFLAITLAFLFFLMIGFIATIIQWLYYALMESSSKKATLGKMALNLIVTDYEGNKISFGRASGRFFAKIISGLIFYIGFLMAAFTEKRQALHDIIASCLILENKKTE